MVTSRRGRVLAVVAGVCAAVGLVSAQPGAPRVTWKGTIDLRQGDTGTIECAVSGAALDGRIVIQRGGQDIVTPIRGEWAANRVTFSRQLSPTSAQPFTGVVRMLPDGRAAMEGQFAAGLSGQWTAVLARTDATESAQGREPRNPPAERRDGPAVTGPVTIKRPFTPVAPVGVLVDFTAQAPAAKWTNAWSVLPFPGAGSETAGYARVLHDVKIEDGTTRPRALETRPHDQPRGRVQGWYGVTVPAAGAELHAGLAYRDGARDSDGVYFVVRGEFPGYGGVEVRREYQKAYNGSAVTDFVQDLSRFKGLTGTIILSVDAGPISAVQDDVVWIDPVLVPAAAAAESATFVGGAVGTAREGDRLVNAWGGKAGGLHGAVTLYLLFANVDRPYQVSIESFQGGHSTGTTNLGMVQKGQRELWVPLVRTTLGECRERVIFNGTYVGDIRYTVSKPGGE
jgi:hypothetical protein